MVQINEYAVQVLGNDKGREVYVFGFDGRRFICSRLDGKPLVVDYAAFCEMFAFMLGGDYECIESYSGEQSKDSKTKGRLKDRDRQTGKDGGDSR